MRVDAIVLAGGDGAVIDPGCRFKGLVNVAGRPMVEWVVDAMREAEMVEGLAVVVPTAEDLGGWADKVDKVVVSDRSFMDNVVAGIVAFRVDRPVLVVTGDLPLLRGEDVDDFVRASLATGADFTYPLIPEQDMVAAFPGGERTFVKLSTGRVTGGNMMLVNPSLVPAIRGIGQRMFDTRKSPAAMAKVLGVRFFFKLATGRLDPAMVEKKLGQLLGGTGAAIVTHRAALGMDVDKPADVVLAERMLGTAADRFV
ncbi:MAG: nucleotidyltransferase family protein [Coriobacteriia bacterium]